MHTGTDVMTNLELLKTPRAPLGALDRQRQFLLHVALVARPCPDCGRPLNLFQAAGLEIDPYDQDGPDPPLCCPECQAEPEQVVPLFPRGPLWFWGVKPAADSAFPDAVPAPPELPPHPERTDADGP
jgi:hypothetical protein